MVTYGFFTTTGTAGVATVPPNNSIPFAAGTAIATGGISYASPTITVANAGVYQIIFGAATTSAANTTFGLSINGAVPLLQNTLGMTEAKEMNSLSIIVTLPAGALLRVQANALRRLIPPSGTGAGALDAVSSYLTIFKLND
ncbi:MAG: hypothetical protein AB7O96_15435 [Pseudobdellovibrionaceae bacterium]